MVDHFWQGPQQLVRILEQAFCSDHTMGHRIQQEDIRAS